MRSSRPIPTIFSLAVSWLIVTTALTSCMKTSGDMAKDPAQSEAIQAQPGALSFVVIGDTPYSKADRKMLELAVPKIKADAAPFVIHIGDFKGGGQECTAAHDDSFAALIEALKPVPVFYTPGDNEWVDCDRFKRKDSGEYYSEYERLEALSQRFFAGAPSGAEALSYTRQESGLNAAWETENIRFATLHWTGTANGRKWIAGDDPAIAKPKIEARETANMVWLKTQFEQAKTSENAALILAIHADVSDVDKEDIGKACTMVSANGDLPCDAFAGLRAALSAHARDFAGPVLVVHGDTSPFTLNQDFLTEGAPNLWRLNAAGDAGIGRTGQKYGTVDVTRVTVMPDSAVPFAASGLVTGKVAKTTPLIPRKRGMSGCFESIPPHKNWPATNHSGGSSSRFLTG